MTKTEKKRQLLMEQIQELMKENQGILRTSQLYELNLDYRKIQRLVELGLLARVKNGYYSLGEKQEEKTGLKREEQMIAGLFPDGVLTLESALYYYHYLRERPYCWHIAIDKNTSKSRFKLEYPLVEPHYTEGEYLSLGVSVIPLGDGIMQIYEKERLICDCMKFEDKLEREVMQEALRCYLREPIKDIHKLMEYARARRVVQKVQSRIGAWL
ncbi:MAG: type IV toxin-antitoxin system AbiEi family antitoxin domain-containing protein [Lachnospiraceae bacterium]|nr:type IV toxin-antitoxin system AbiEi family antitoxin domain-containing protein [Lachnospiraceae bacterium]